MRAARALNIERFPRIKTRRPTTITRPIVLTNEQAITAQGMLALNTSVPVGNHIVSLIENPETAKLELHFRKLKVPKPKSKRPAAQQSPQPEPQKRQSGTIMVTKGQMEPVAKPRKPYWAVRKPFNPLFVKSLGNGHTCLFIALWKHYTSLKEDGRLNIVTPKRPANNSKPKSRKGRFTGRRTRPDYKTYEYKQGPGILQ